MMEAAGLFIMFGLFWLGSDIVKAARIIASRKKGGDA